MIKYFENLAKALLGIRFSDLSKEEQKVISSIANAEPVVENVNEIYEDELTFGQSLADKIANIAGSWPFIIIFLLTLFGWMSLNTFILVDSNKAFDPYPYILLNLVLSSLAALQAPLIMMSQNRQADKDRLTQKANYEVSLRSDLEIILMQKKLDELKEQLGTIMESTTANNR